MIGHKRIIFAIDEANASLAATRKVFTQFFKEVIGFEEKEIIFVDRSEFNVYQRNGNWECETKFSDSTKEKITNFGLPIFTDK